MLALDESLFRELLGEHPEFRARVEERVQHLRARSGDERCPLDFPELLPADATEAALVSTSSEPEARSGARHRGSMIRPPTSAPAATPASAVGRRFRRARFPYVAPARRDGLRRRVPCDGLPPLRTRGRARRTSGWRSAPAPTGPACAGSSAAASTSACEIRAVKASKDRVEQLPLPAIIHWGGNHWVVLYAVDGDHVDIADPARRLRRIDRAELEEQWSGYAALPTPTPRLAEAPLGRASARWLGEFVRPYRRRLLVGVALALVAAGLEMLFPVLTQQVFDHVLVHRNYSLLNILTIAMLGVLALSLLVTMVQRRLLARIAVGIDVAHARLHHRAPLRAADLLLRDAADRRHRTAPGRRPRDPRDARAGRDRGAHRRRPSCSPLWPSCSSTRGRWRWCSWRCCRCTSC